MTTIHIYCDHFGSEGAEDDVAFIDSVDKAGGGEYGFVRSGDPMELDELLASFLENEDRSSVRDEFMTAISSLLCGEEHSVYNGETDNFLFAAEDKGDRIKTDHSTMFAHFRAQEEAAAYLGTPLEKVVDRSGISFLVSQEGGGYRYTAYGHKDGFVRLGSVLLPERLASPVIYDVLTHMAENDLLVGEIAEVMGADWQSLARHPSQGAPAPGL